MPAIHSKPASRHAHVLEDKANDICYRSPSAPGIYSVGIILVYIVSA
jgi:hypothetical protein